MISSKKKARLIENACSDKKGFDIICLDVRKISPVTDYMILVSGTSDRHVRAIAQNVLDCLDEMGETFYHCDGMNEGSWVLVDASDCMVHLFKESAREFYDLEHLWQQAKRIELK